MVWADADIFWDDWFISDKWRFSEGSSCPLLAQYPLRGANANHRSVLWMEQVSEGHFNNQQLGIPNYIAGGSFFFFPLHFFFPLSYTSGPHLTVRIFYAHCILYWSTATLARQWLEECQFLAQIALFNFSEWKTIRYSPHMLFILKLFFAKCPSGLHLNFLEHYLLWHQMLCNHVNYGRISYFIW